MAKRLTVRSPLPLAALVPSWRRVRRPPPPRPEASGRARRTLQPAPGPAQAPPRQRSSAPPQLERAARRPPPRTAPLPQPKRYRPLTFEPTASRTQAPSHTPRPAFDLRHPPKCRQPKHSRRFTTQRCIHCSTVRCWKCAKRHKKPPLLLHFVCPPCRARVDLHDLATFGRAEPAPISETALATLASLHATEEEAGIASGAGRELTLAAHAGNILRMREWADANFEIDNLPGPWPAPVIKAFIHHHVQRDHVWSVVAHYMSSLRRWLRFQAALLKVAPDMSQIDSLEVRTTLRYAEFVMPQVKKVRLPVAVSQLKLSLDSVFSVVPPSALTREALVASAANPAPVLSDEQWDQLMDAWADIHLFISFIRRTRLGAVTYEYTPYTAQHWTEHQLERLPDTVQWHASIDDDGDTSVMLVGTKEKNFHIRNKSKRFYRDNNVTGLPLASLAIWLAQQLRLPAGPLLRRRDGRAWGKTDWSAYLDRFALRTGFHRPHLGTTSFRRGLATTLREHGISEADIQFLGYWFSAASDKYTGAARMARLHVLSGISASSTSVPARRWGSARTPSAPAGGC